MKSTNSNAKVKRYFHFRGIHRISKEIIFRTNWYKNRFVRGSYLYYFITSSTKDGEQRRMAYALDRV